MSRTTVPYRELTPPPPLIREPFPALVASLSPELAAMAASSNALFTEAIGVRSDAERLAHAATVARDTEVEAIAQAHLAGTADKVDRSGEAGTAAFTEAADANREALAISKASNHAKNQLAAAVRGKPGQAAIDKALAEVGKLDAEVGKVAARISELLRRRAELLGSVAAIEYMKSGKSNKLFSNPVVKGTNVNVSGQPVPAEVVLDALAELVSQEES